MDSDPSAPEFASQVSSQSGSAPLSSSLEASDDNEVLMQKPEVGNNDDTNVFVNGGGGFEDGVTEKDGFVSGDEEFETPMARAVRSYSDEKSSESGFVHGPFVNSEEFFTPKAWRGIAEESVDDDKGDDKLEKGDGGGGDFNLAGEEDAAEKLESGEEEKGGYEDGVVQTESIKGSGFSDDVHEDFVENGKVEESTDSVFEGGMVAEQNGVEVHNLKDEEAVKEQSSYDLQQETPVEVDNGAQVVRTESSYDNSVENDDVKCTSAGDSIVDTVQVDVLFPSGVAIVGEKEDLDDSEIKGMETPAGVSLDNGFDPIEREVEEPFEESTTSEVKSDLIVDDDSKHADNGFDPIEREVEEPFEESTTSEVTSDLNVDDNSKHAEKGVHIASPEKVEKLDFESPSVDTEVKDDEAVKEENSEILYDTQKPLPVEPESGSQVFTAGDSVVDTAQVNLLPSGVAVVGDKEVIDASEIQGMEAPASGVSLDNGFEPIEGDAEEPFDKIATSDVNSEHSVDNAVDDNNKHAEKGMNIAPPEEVEKLDVESHIVDREIKDLQEVPPDEVETSSHVEASGESIESEYVDPISSSSQETRQGENDEGKHNPGNRVIDGSASDDEAGGMIFGSSEAARRFMEELEQHSGAESSRDPSQRLDGQIVTDSDEEVDTDEEGDGKEIFDSAALAALLKAATGAGQDGGNITITAQDGSRLFSVERPAGLGSSLQSIKPAARSNRVGLYPPSYPRVGADSDSNLSEEEKKKLEKVQQLRIKHLRLIERLGFTPEESIAAQTLFRLTLITGRQNSQLFTLDDAKRSASELEAEGKDDLDFSLNILVIGKSGVGKSATINSIFGEAKTSINAYGPATTNVTEIVGMVDGVKIRVFDTPGLKSYAAEQNFNRKVLSTVKKFTKKSSPDIVLFVDRLDTPSRNLNDLPLLKTVTDVLGTSIWQNAIVTLTHAASAPPDGPSGSPIGYDAFVAQRSHIVQQSIGQAVGDLRLMNPSLMNPVSLAENHPSCRKNRDGEKVLPNGQSWRPQLLLLCYSMKILAEAANLYKTQDKSDHRKLFGFRVRSPPLPYLLSWLLQSRTHPKLSADQGGDNADSDIELADLSDSDIDEDEDEYDQLPPFKPLKQSQIDKLSREQRKAYFDEYEYRVKLLQKKQWREELKRMRDMKRRGKTTVDDYNYMEEDDQENGSPAAVPVPLPDMVLPPSFDCDNPAYRYRFLEPTSQLLTRPVLDNHGWDHDCGYDGVNLEQTLAIINRFPAAVTVQVTKDKKDFSIHLDSSVAAKHGENGSTMAGFDIQNIGKQIAYICRGETKFKNFKRNKTAAGVSVTFLGENVTTGLKIEDQIALGKRLVLVGSTGTVRCQGDSAYGANVEVRIREADFPIGQDQSSLGLSLVKWRGDLALGANFQSQFSVGRNYKMAVRAGLNNKLSGQISVRTSSSDQLQIALVAILPIARAIYKNFWPGARENDSIY